MSQLSAALRKPGPLCALLALLILAAALAGLAFGATPVHAADVIRALLGAAGLVPPADPGIAATVLELRLPRVLLGLCVGGALAVSGAAMQGIFRNPLGDPGLVGVSSGAALAAAALLVLAGPARGGHWLPLAAFAGAAAATALVLRLSSSDGVARPAQMLLIGLAVNAIAGAGIGLMAHLASDSALRALTFWMYGSLERAQWPEIAVAAPLMLAAGLLLPRHAAELNALLLGEAEAAHVGVDVERLRRRVVLLVLVAVGAAVAVSGIIAFVGLVVPQLVRLWAGPDHRAVLPASALLGAALLTAADTAARTVAAPVELPIGILTALIGGPFFIGMLLQLKSRGEML
ncbi:MAG: iron ABC transporter permease [Nevskia sp.]|nr:iron ABC transporter permease [Nevskia sp.]